MVDEVARIHEFTLQASLIGELADSYDSMASHLAHTQPEKDIDAMIHQVIRSALEHALGHLNEDIGGSGLIYTLKS